MPDVLIRRYGNLIDISSDGTNPPDPRVIAMLRPVLSYSHKTMLRGHHCYGPDGQKRTIDIEVRNMFNIEEGRLVTGFGFLTSVAEVLASHGVTAGYVDMKPPADPSVYVPDWDNVRSIMEFRPGQEECLYYVSQNQCGLIDATMGFGKTFLFEAVSHLYPKATVDITVFSSDIAAGIRRRLSRTIPNVGQVGGGKKFYGDRVTVYTAKSAHYAQGRNAHFLLGDEVHQLMTDSVADSISSVWRFTRNFGFSATPHGRADGASARLEMFFGRTIFRMTYQEAKALGLVVPIHVRWLPIRMTHNPASGKDGVSRMRCGIWTNYERNRAIAEDVRSNYPDVNKQILILVATVEHAVHLWQHLPEFSLCYGNMDDDRKSRYIQDGLLPRNFVNTTSDIRDRMRDEFEKGSLKRVIATDIWATGVDFVNLDVMYRADGRSSDILDSQGPGRVSRISEDSDKYMGTVVDCLDLFDKNFKNRSYTRRRNYTSMGWSQDWPRI